MNIQSIINFLFLTFRFADHVSIGDAVLVQGISDLTPGKVINVSNFPMQGNRLHLVYMTLNSP